jgi:NitT/TauT family transport system substrate-binding protein
MNIKIRISTLLILVIAATIFLILISTKKNDTARFKGGIQKVNLGVTSPVLSALIWVAEKKGFFIKNGLDVNIEEHEFSGGILKGIATGRLDLGTTMDISFALDELVDKGNMKIISIIAKSDRTELIGRKDHSIENISDLKGKKVGVTPTTNAEFFLEEFLFINNIVSSEIETVYLTPTDLVFSILNGNIDAAITWTTNAYPIITALGDNAISWPAQSGLNSNWIVAASEDFIEKSPEAVERFVQALLDADAYIKDYNHELYDIILSHKKITKEYLDYAKTKQQYTVELTQSIIVLIEDQTRWAIKNNITERSSIPNYLEYIYSDALEKVKPNAITIMR